MEEETEERQLPELYLKEVIQSPDGRDPETGKFLPGSSGNPKGRPKGAKNRITELKENMELALREGFNPEVVKAVAASMVAEALNGNVQAGKYILDKFMTNAGSGDDKGEVTNAEYVFIVKGMTEDDLPKEVRGETINHEENHGE